MSAPVLSISEQKSAISGKKKKKKAMKNVLGIPSNLKVEIQLAEEKDTEKLTEILNRLLPSARLSTQLNSKPKKDSNGQVNQPQQYIRRNELSLGVNNLSRSIKKALVSAALIAADVQPKFLIHHLNLLCSQNKVPFLHMPGLRETTKINLGFSCIAVGFKKESVFFVEVIEEIRSIWERRKVATINSDEESEVESCWEESNKEETRNENSEKETTPFSYLMRSSKTERVFVPESIKTEERKEKMDFIELSKEDNGNSFKNSPTKLGISSNLVKKEKEMRSRNLDDDSEEEDLEVPRKKAKKDWVIDKVGQRAKYYPTNYVRVPSNPNRCRKK